MRHAFIAYAEENQPTIDDKLECDVKHANVP
jgi:hypothetical protein